MKNKILKVIGNILVIVAVIFVFRKLLSYDIHQILILVITLEVMILIILLSLL